MGNSLTRAKVRELIEQQLIQPGPYSHNLIGIYLASIAKRFGKADANKLIRDFGLDKLGWKEMPR